MRITAPVLNMLPVVLFVQACPVLAFPGGSLDEDAETAVILFLLLFALFMIPTIVAFVRSHPNRWPIAIINVFFGGTGVGWVGSLIWALQAIHRSPTGNHGGESGLNLFANDIGAAPVHASRPLVATDIDMLSARLLRLKALHENGALSMAEYDALKREALYGR